MNQIAKAHDIHPTTIMQKKIIDLIDRNIKSREKYFNELKMHPFNKKQKKSLYKLHIQLQLLRMFKRKIDRIIKKKRQDYHEMPKV